MLQFLIKFFKSKPIKLAFKLLASFASVIFVVSGYIFFQKSRNEDELEAEQSPIVEINAEPDSESKQEEKKVKSKVHFLFGNKKN